jgi:phosphoribosylglycinamide formyltransferase-1
MKPIMKNIAVFVSGTGTNLQAIIDAIKRGEIKANISLVVSDNRDAYALVRAKKSKIDIFCFDPSRYKKREAYEKEIIKELEKRNICLIILAGFMKVLTPFFIRKYKNKILNIHPALLPSFKGTEAVREALEYGVKVTGVTIHFVDEGVDTGPIILQKAVKIEEEDNEDTLFKKIHRIEHELYPKAIKLFLENKLKIEDRRVKIYK